MKALIALALASAAVLSNAALYDLTSDFSITNGNPNGPWSYGYRTGSGPIFSPFTAFDSTVSTATYIGWRSGTVDNPQVSQYLGSGTQNGVPSGSVLMHGGAGNELASIRFTLPESGIVSVNGTLGQGDSGAVDLYVLFNGIQVSGTTNIVNTLDFSATSPISLPAGSTVEVLLGTSGSYFFDSTPISATIQVGSPVPEPATMAALGFGALALLKRRRKS